MHGRQPIRILALHQFGEVCVACLRRSWVLSWPQAAAMSSPRSARTLLLTPPARSVSRKARIASPDGTAVAGGGLVDGDEIDVAELAQRREQCRQFARVLRRVVDARQQHILERHLPIGARDIRCGRRRAPARSDICA